MRNIVASCNALQLLPMRTDTIDHIFAVIGRIESTNRLDCELLIELVNIL